MGHAAAGPLRGRSANRCSRSHHRSGSWTCAVGPHEVAVRVTTGRLASTRPASRRDRSTWRTLRRLCTVLALQALQRSETIRALEYGSRPSILNKGPVIETAGGALSMSDKSKIEWTDATWNPVRGCTRSARAASTATPRPSPSGSGACRATPTSRASTCAWCPRSSPSRSAGRRPKMVFVNSMSDLFHEDVPDDYIEHGRRR